MTPRSSFTLPAVPSSVQPGVSAMSPLSRIGGWTPSLNCSVIAISTCEYFRVGPRTRTRSIRPFGPMMAGAEESFDVLLLEKNMMGGDFYQKRTLFLRFERAHDVRPAQRAQRFAGHHAFLVGRHDQDGHLRVVR